MRWGRMWSLAAWVVLGSLPVGADLPAIRDRGVLRVLASPDELPELFAVTDGVEPGLEREILQGFARMARLKLEVVVIQKYEDRIPALVRGDGDVLIGVIDTEARRKQIDFTVEVLPSRHVAVTCKPHISVESVEALRAQPQVGVLKATSWAQAVSEAGVPAARTQAFETMEVLLTALCNGKVDATAMSYADFAAAAKREPRLHAGVGLGAPVRSAWGVRKQDGALLEALDAYLENFRKGSSWNRLIVRYFGPQSLAVLGRN